MKRYPLLCASIMEESIPEVIKIASSVRDADLIEIRADAIKEISPRRVIELLREVKKVSGKDVILTVRPLKEGGLYQGTEDDRRFILEAGLEETDYVDLELDTSQLEGLVKKASETGVKTIISHHNFESTPSREIMLSLLKREFNAGADIAKLAVKARTMEDVLNLLSVTVEASREGNICTIAMGNLGKIARVAAPFFGSTLLYGYVSNPTAPGQLSVSELRKILNIMGV